MVTLDTLRVERREEILRLAQRRGAHNLRVFGSVARGEANETTDLDLLVALEPGRSLLDHAGLVQDLQELLGIKVHVGTEKSLHWRAGSRPPGAARDQGPCRYREIASLVRARQDPSRGGASVKDDR